MPGSTCSQDATKGLRPMASGSMYTIPHRETVAGDATLRSSTSKIIVIVGGIFGGASDPLKRDGTWRAP